MEIKKTKESKSLLLTFIKEIKNGKTFYETRKISNLKVDAIDEDVYTIALKILEICDQENFAVKLQDVSLVQGL